MDNAISEHRKGWKKFIGGRRFYSYSGMTEEEFRRVVTALQDRWETIAARGGTWTQTDIDEAYTEAGVERRGPNAVHMPPTTGVTAQRMVGSQLYLHASLDEYLTSMATRVPKEVGIDQLEKYQQHLGRLKVLLPDQPIHQIGYDTLASVKTLVLNAKRKDGKPFAPDSLLTIWKCIKAFWQYLDDSNKWTAPRGFRKLMQLDRTTVTDEDDEEEDDDELDDLDAGEDRTFSVEELTTLWQRAITPMSRIVFGLGLYAGFTANDFASLRKKMIVTDGDDLFIVRKRQKTRHRQKYRTWWWIPPEIAVLIRRAVLCASDPEKNPKGLLFMTRNGLPLVHRGSKGKGRKTDNVALVWRALIRSAHKYGGVKNLSQKHLRKTGARLIRYGVGDWKGAGLESTQRFLAHAVRTVAEKHYVGRPRFSELHAAQRELYARLKPLVIDRSSKEPSPGTKVA